MAVSHPQPPTIVVNTPGHPTSTVSAPRTIPASNNGQSSATKIDTSQNHSANAVPGEKSCYLCDEQNPGDFSPTTKFLETCLLCARHFCPIHKATQWDGVCDINHSQYYHECLEKAKSELATKSPDGTAKGEEVEEALVQEGVYPSLGEREKAIFKTSPVSPAKMREIENFRNLDAEISGTKGMRASSLIEVKDAVGADIAV